MILREFVDPVNPADSCRPFVKSPCSQGIRKWAAQNVSWKGDPRAGLLSNTWKGTVWGDTHTDESKRLLKRGAGWRAAGKTTPENCPATRLAVLGFKGMVLSFWLSLHNQLACAHIWSDSRSFPVAHASLGQDGFNSEGFWEADWHLSLHSAPPKFSWLVFAVH